MQENSLDVLGLDEFRVIDKEENGSDLLFTVEPKESPSECVECGSTNITKHGKYERFVRDANYFNKKVAINIIGNRYKCHNCGITFVGDYVSVCPKDRMTLRLRNKIKEQALKDTYSKIAEEYSLTKQTVRNVFLEYVEEQERQRVLHAPTVLGIDEAHLSKSMRGVLVDVENARIIEMLETRSKESVEKYLFSIPDRHNIKVVTMDMWKPYKNAVNYCLPYASIVVDRFHVIKELNEALDTIRKRIIGRDSIVLKSINKRNIKYLLCSAIENIDQEKQKQLDYILRAYPDLQIAYSIKEAFRFIYECPDRASAEEQFKDWEDLVVQNQNEYPEFLNILKTVKNWHKEIFNYFDYRYTNGITEALNGTIKSIERAGRGYTFEVIRAKMLFANNAVKPAKFSYTKSNTSNRPSNAFSLSFGFSFGQDERKLICGSGVDILELQQLFDNNEF